MLVAIVGTLYAFTIEDGLPEFVLCLRVVVLELHQMLEMVVVGLLPHLFELVDFYVSEQHSGDLADERQLFFLLLGLLDCEFDLPEAFLL